MNLAICSICKDPIWSFICPDCLSRDIQEWLPQRLSRDFREFNRSFLHHFRNIEEQPLLYCIHCKERKEANVCPFCYISEASQWLAERDQNLAYKLVSMLPLASDWIIMEDGSVRWKDGVIPVTETQRKTSHEGLCELCDEYSENLQYIEGKWICEHCR